MIKKTNQKQVSRPKNKKQKDLEDMITVFKTIDPEQLPMFVAYDLHKLPPVCFDHVDVTKLLKDLLILLSDVNAIKSDYVTKEQLKDMKLNERKSKSIKSNNKIITKRGGYIEEDCSILAVPPNVACPSVQSEPSASSKTMNHERMITCGQRVLLSDVSYILRKGKTIRY
ncbi:unnamed protein product [Leptidea sinapis]|uniref:Uncharacterized protein n=1 Tax=Leptidea sinapis TaxID=189913 RepID=A0A5E4QMN6_9NEOP|nr:unnamed protein product [Leptidea sinapis]